MAAKLTKVFFLILAFVSSMFLFAVAVKSEEWKSLAIKRELNREGAFLGLIAVTPTEEEAFFATGAFRPDHRYPNLYFSGRRFWAGKVDGTKLIYVRCGVGMVNAAAATQQMLDLFDIVGIVHFGVAGNANNSLSIGDVIIPKQFAQTGLWNWLKPDAKEDKNDVVELDFGRYNVPNGGFNQLGRVGYGTEEFFSESGNTNNIPQRTQWFETSKDWMELASGLEGIKLQQCVNSSLCLPLRPQLVAGLSGSTANFFIDNAAYRNFLFTKFHVSSIDMESAAVVMTSSSNGFPVIVIRGLSDLAGAEDGGNLYRLFGPLAASNAANAVLHFVKKLEIKNQ